MSATLSICLPTHHGRAAVLDRCLRSVLGQIDEAAAGRVQICISDNGSHDETQAVIARYRERLGDALADHRFERNEGFTTNLLKATELATGDFCWLLGSDDEIEPGGIATVLGVLDAHPGLTGMTLNRRNVDDLNPDASTLDDPAILPPPGRTLYTSAEEVFAELAMLQDYISTQVVNRRAWVAAVEALGPGGLAAGRNFPHLPLLGEMILRAPRWYWESRPLIVHRIGVRAVEATFGPDLVDYTIIVNADRAAIWSAMFGRRSPLYRAAMRRAWLVQLSPFAVAHYKQQQGQTLAADWRLLVEMTRIYWFLPDFWLRSFPVLLMPHGLVPLVSAVAQRVRAATA